MTQWYVCPQCELDTTQLRAAPCGAEVCDDCRLEHIRYCGWCRTEIAWLAADIHCHTKKDGG